MEMYVHATRHSCVCLTRATLQLYMWNDENALWECKADISKLATDNQHLLHALNESGGPLRHVISKLTADHNLDQDNQDIKKQLEKACALGKDATGPTAAQVLQQLSTMQEIERPAEWEQMLNTTLYELPVANNEVIDLRTGCSRPRTRNDMWTYAIKAAWNPNADTTEWAKIILDIFDNSELNKEYGEEEKYRLRRSQQWHDGYRWTGSLAGEMCVMAFGGGGNGKGLKSEIERYAFEAGE